MDPSIKIIAIDEKTLEALGQFETWTREPYAELIELLNDSEYAPKVIGFDVLFVNEKGEEDQLLVDACKKYSNIVMANNLVFSTKIETKDGKSQVNPLHIDMVENPFGQLTGIVRTGFANAVQDTEDNSVRYALLERDGYQSFAAAIVLAVAESDADTVDPVSAMPIDANNGIFIDYTGGVDSYETLSMIDVLEGKIPLATFSDSIVLVGVHAAGMGDSYAVPVQKGAQMYGVEIHANIIQCLLEQRCLVSISKFWNAVFYAALVFVFVLLTNRMKIWMNALGAVLLIAAQYFLCL